MNTDNTVENMEIWAAMVGKIKKAAASAAAW
jgi:hypothetical protein